MPPRRRTELKANDTSENAENSPGGRSRSQLKLTAALLPPRETILATEALTRPPMGSLKLGTIDLRVRDLAADPAVQQALTKGAGISLAPDVASLLASLLPPIISANPRRVVAGSGLAAVLVASLPRHNVIRCHYIPGGSDGDRLREVVPVLYGSVLVLMAQRFTGGQAGLTRLLADDIAAGGVYSGAGAVTDQVAGLMDCSKRAVAGWLQASKRQRE